MSILIEHEPRFYRAHNSRLYSELYELFGGRFSFLNEHRLKLIWEDDAVYYGVYYIEFENNEDALFYKMKYLL